MPACTTTNNAACFNPMAEYGYGILDVPHRVIIAPICRTAVRQGKKCGARAARRNASSADGRWRRSFNLQSGFPIGLSQSDNLGLLGNGQRPNLVSGVDLATPGDLAARLASADHPTATWLNPAAFSLAPANTYGNAPRTITDLRTPRIINTDVSFIKEHPARRQAGSGEGRDAQHVQPRQRARWSTTAPSATRTSAQDNTQAGFMRVTQIMFRFSF